jgi:hypothetical protein
MWRNFSRAHALSSWPRPVRSLGSPCFDEATFAVFDAFNDEAGRTAHLNGAIAAALMANAADLLAVHPEIRQPVILADKLPA